MHPFTRTQPPYTGEKFSRLFHSKGQIDPQHTCFQHQSAHRSPGDGHAPQGRQVDDGGRRHVSAAAENTHDVGGAIGSNGYLNIIRKNNITDSNYSGLVPLVSGEVAEDFAEYFVKSMQKPTVLALGVLVNKDGVKKAGGFLLNLMPDAEEEVIVKIEEALSKAPSISKMLDDDTSLEDIVKTVTGDENPELIDDSLKMEYECDCTRCESGRVETGNRARRDNGR